MPPALTASDPSVLDRFLLPALPESETKLDLNLLWTRLEIKGLTTWNLVDTGSVSNIVSARYYQSIPLHPPPLAPSPEERLISGHNVELPLLGKVAFGSQGGRQCLLPHFYVIDNFQLEALLGSEFLNPHECTAS